MRVKRPFRPTALKPWRGITDGPSPNSVCITLTQFCITQTFISYVIEVKNVFFDMFLLLKAPQTLRNTVKIYSGSKC
jgi:hypothetical protein